MPGGGACSCPSMPCSVPCPTFVPIVPVAFVHPLVGRGEVQEFHVTGEAKLWLSGSHIEGPTNGALGWFSQRFDLFSKRIEALSLSDVVFKLGDFFSAVELKNVALVEVDHQTVYYDKGDEKTHDLGLALDRTQAFLGSPNREQNDLTFSTIGEEQELMLTVVAQFWRKHEAHNPSLKIDAIGVPSEFLRKPDETMDRYKARMLSFIDDLDTWDKIKRFPEHYVKKMSNVLDHYLSQANSVFDIERAEKGEISNEGFPPIPL